MIGNNVVGLWCAKERCSGSSRGTTLASRSARCRCCSAQLVRMRMRKVCWSESYVYDDDDVVVVVVVNCVCV